MKLYNNYINFNNKIPAFKQIHPLSNTASIRECYTTTEFFRDDFDIDGLINYANNFYKDTPKVNVISYACSTGKETYSLALKLKTNLKDKAIKFLPLIAKDIDANCILKAKRGRYKISDSEAQKIDRAGGINLYRYIDIIDDGLEQYSLVKDSLKKDIEFKKADICEDIESIPNKNTILICRNFWTYLQPTQQIELADKIAKKFDKTSLVVIGSFEKAYGIDKLLETRGFKKTEIQYVMRKEN